MEERKCRVGVSVEGYEEGRSRRRRVLKEERRKRLRV